MIKATFIVNDDNQYVGFHMNGHADFDEHGKDIVCAGASAVAYGIFNSVLSLTKTKPTFQIEDGLMNVTDISDSEDVQLLMRSLEVSLETIEAEYKTYISISKQRGE